MVEQIKSAVNKRFRKESSRVTDALAKRSRIEFQGFSGSSPIFILSDIVKSSGTLLYIARDFEKAASAASDFEEISESKVFLFPPTRHSPYDDQVVTDLSVQVQRTEVLEVLNRQENLIIVASPDAVADKLVPAKQFYSSSIHLKKGDEYAPGKLSEELGKQGYSATRFVDAPGEYAVRGGILDVFPYSGEYPVRLEFFGDEIDSIREFDPDSQRSIAFLNETRLVPNVAQSDSGQKESLFSYLPANALLAVEDVDLASKVVEEHFEKALEMYTGLVDSDKPEPADQFLTDNEWNEALQQFGLLLFGSFNSTVQTDLSWELNTSPHPSFNGSFKLLKEFITRQSSKENHTYILTDHQNQKERFENILGESADDFRYSVLIQNLQEGFLLPDQNISILTDHQIFNRYHRPRIKRKRVRGGISFKELKDLNIGDYVVHVDYGIGRFAGFKRIEVRSAVQEAAVVRYKEDSTLYVNVSSLHKLQKYSGKEGKQPRITKLGSGQWARKKASTRKKVKDIAKDLIELYAKRKAQKAFEFSTDNAWQTEMEAHFEFEETPDQLSAIQSVKEDMESSQPMDRLICGDVGFGKTEVAIRAAFKAVMDQKQVAILVPTTILADQHYKTFSNRMKEFPVRVDVISRFRSRAEQKEILEDLESGTIDILIGTHRIISGDVKFKDLGLLVIDEEQRFGVAVKEKLKSLRATIDVLTLTATPIPRTLQFSLMGARDLSIINTPPPNRQPVYTEIHSFDENLIRDAIIQETSRGGQVFFIHNRVKNIEEVTSMIRELVPDIRVRFAHGQMTGSKLEKIIRDFYLNKFDVLVSTNIVENGIDIANANTMIINNANNFGLSELHQLRGRVGRSNRKAFCYLITPPVNTLTPEARKRLTALEEFSDLGSGFNIAMRDLDIRGAGDILGAEQSGYISDVGFELYTKILDDAVRELKETEYKSVFEHEEKKIDYPETKVEFDHSAYLENTYVQDSVERLNLYRKLSEAGSIEEIEDWKRELEDRFGKLPDSGLNLVRAAKMKYYASRLFLKKVTVRSDRMWLLCPKNEGTLGDHFYEKGYFQKLLELIQYRESYPYKVVQKNEAVTLVIQNIMDTEAAIDYLGGIYQIEKSNTEPVA